MGNDYHFYIWYDIPSTEKRQLSGCFVYRPFCFIIEPGIGFVDPGELKNMMSHLAIFLFLVCLIAGTWAIAYSYHCAKIYHHILLRTLVKYLLLQNLGILILLVKKYIWTNFPDLRQADSMDIFYIMVLFLLIVISSGWIYYYVRLGLGLMEIDFSGNYKKIAAGVLLMITASVIIGLTVFKIRGSNLWMHETFRVVMTIAFAAFISLTLVLIFRKEKGNRGRQTATRIFGAMGLLGYGIFFSSCILSDTGELIFSCLGLLLLNLAPVIWLKKSFLPNYMCFFEKENTGYLESFFTHHGISKRERDIIDLVIRGKSNREIEDLLYISYNTVKNHIYNLYKKLGVQSRGQMILLVVEARMKQEKWEK